MTSCCVRYLNWFINQMVEQCFWSSGFMLSPLLEEERKKEKLSLLFEAVNHERSPRVRTALTKERPAVIRWWKSLWGEKKQEGESKHFHKTLYDNFDTCAKSRDTEWRRYFFGGLKGQTNGTGVSLQSAARPLCCSVSGPSFQLSLPTRSATGAHSWPLVFPWQTAISQSSTSPLCSHCSPHSAPCQKSLSDSSSGVGLVQVSAGDLRGRDAIHTTCARFSPFSTAGTFLCCQIEPESLFFCSLHHLFF